MDNHYFMLTGPLQKIRDTFQDLVIRRPSFAGVLQIDTSGCPTIYEVRSNLFFGIRKVKWANGEGNQFWFLIDASGTDLVFIPSEGQHLKAPLLDRTLVGTISSVFRQDLIGNLSIQLIRGDIDRPGFPVYFHRYLFLVNSGSLSCTSVTSCTVETAFNESEYSGQTGNWKRISAIKLWD